MNKIVSILVLIILSLLAYIYFQKAKAPTTHIPTPAPVVSEAPLPSVTPHPLIIVSAPQPNERVTFPLTVTGQAKGNWFFEASFPVVLTDANGAILAQGIAMAEGEWMTEEFVPFKAELTFTPSTAVAKGILILHKANASGMPENDDSVEVPVLFE